MKSTFNDQVQKMRDGVNDLRNKNKEPQPNPQVSSVSSKSPVYYYHPPPTSSPIDPYSHTANSTAGFAQTNAYPTLATSKPQAEKQVLRKYNCEISKNFLWIIQTFLGKVESTATNLLGHVVGQDRIVSVVNNVNSSITSGQNARVRLKSISVQGKHLLIS